MSLAGWRRQASIDGRLIKVTSSRSDPHRTEPAREPRLYIANAEALLQRGQRFAGWNVFLAEVAFVARGENGFDDGGVVQFLRLVDFVASGVAAGVVVGEVVLV